jgi:hypothetical protein
VTSDSELSTGAVADGGGHDGSTGGPRRNESLRRALPVIGLVAAGVAVLPPYTASDICTSTRVEVADHVVPAVLMALLSLAALVAARRPRPGMFPLVAGLGILLAGLWMTATHVPLVAQATRDEVSYGTAAYHTVPGLLVLAFGVVWTATHWGDVAG